jgi:uncharacterized protein
MRRGPRIKGLPNTGVNLVFLFRRITARGFLLAPLLLAALSLILAVPVRAESIASIHPQGYVTDLAGVVDEETTARIEALCTEVDQKTGAQIAVVTVKSLDDQPIENYAHDLFKAIGIGDKKDNRGLLILLSPSEHQYRIEVGRGLEPVIVDARAGDIGRAMVPLLRQGDTSGAIEGAVNQSAQLIAADRGVTLTGLADYQPQRNTREPSIGWIKIVIIVLFVLFALLRSARGGGTGSGGGSGGLWWMALLANSMLSGGSSNRGGFGGSSGGFGGGFGGFGGGDSGGGGASGSW